MRVGFTLIGGRGWTGGINYLENLLSAISECPDSQVEPVLFVGHDADVKVLERLRPFLVEPPIFSFVWGSGKWIRILRLALAVILQRDILAERQFRRAGVKVVFQHGAWYGVRFKLRTIAWIADFQHHHLPHFFSMFNRYWRTLGYFGLAYSADRVMVSSLDAKRDCEKFYPHAKGKIDVVPFAVRLGHGLDNALLETVRDAYHLPDRFYYLPNQFWVHKNHIALVHALAIAKSFGVNIKVVASGNLADGRNPSYPKTVLSLVKEYGLENDFIFLGLIPYDHILPLMRLSIGVLNPSLFEGWSTTVEEAKSVGAPLLLSDLCIHREQAGEHAAFYSANNFKDMSEVLSKEWPFLKAGPRFAAEQEAARKNINDRQRFALRFSSVVESAYDGQC